LSFTAGSAIRRFAEPGLVAAALAAVYLISQPSSADHAAQIFRSGLFEQQGLAAWSNLWFGGHHLPGYSVLFPALGALIGPREVGALATIAAALLFAAIAHRQWGERARLGAIWFAAGAAVSLFTGRLAFALGVPIALGAVFAAQRGHRLSAAGLAALCPLASPVAALFLACGALAHWAAERRREGLEIAAASAGMTVLVAIAFPEGGTEPFVFSSFQPAVLVALAVFIALPKEERLLRYGVAAYGAALAAAFVIDSPMGGNATRMGSLLLGPVAACALWQRGQRFALALLIPLLVYWQWSPVVRDLERVYAEPSVERGYYEPLRDYLRGATRKEQYRVEVLPLNTHWESAYVPRGIHIARGWERQLDRKLNPLFYEETLRPAEYRRWLDQLAVGFVAVPDAPLDYAAEAEARLIQRGLPYLRLAFRSRDWEVYRVRDPAPLTVGAARLVKLYADGFVLASDAPGSVLVRLRWTPYWSISRGSACVEESPRGFTRVRIADPGRIRVGVRFAPWRILGGGPSCNEERVEPDG
jgi:hypothetical protein